jgi:hypothetical protein
MDSGFFRLHPLAQGHQNPRRTDEADIDRRELVSTCGPQASRDWMNHAPEMALFVFRVML